MSRRIQDHFDRMNEFLNQAQQERRESWDEFAEDPSLPIPDEVDCGDYHEVARRMRNALDAEEPIERGVTDATRNIIGPSNSSFGTHPSYTTSLRSTQTGLFHNTGSNKRRRERSMRDFGPGAADDSNMSTRTLSAARSPPDSHPTMSPPKDTYHRIIGGGPRMKQRLTQIMNDENVEPNVRRLAAVDRYNMTFRQQISDNHAPVGELEEGTEADVHYEDDGYEDEQSDHSSDAEIITEKPRKASKRQRLSKFSRSTSLPTTVQLEGSTDEDDMDDDDNSNGRDDAQSALGQLRRLSGGQRGSGQPRGRGRRGGVGSGTYGSRGGRGNYIVHTNKKGKTKALKTDEWYGSAGAKKFKLVG